MDYAARWQRKWRIEKVPIDGRLATTGINTEVQWEIQVPVNSNQPILGRQVTIISDSEDQETIAAVCKGTATTVATEFTAIVSFVG